MSKQRFYPHLADFLYLQASLIRDGIADVSHGGDMEAIHQLRVTMRRTRSVLDTFDEGNHKVMRSLRELGRRLGRVRDLDVQIEALRNQPGLTDYRAYLHDERHLRRDEMRDTLRGHRSTKLPPAIEALADALPRDDRSLNKAARKFLGRQLKQVKQRGRAISTASPTSDLHALRIECKRLRYLAEMFSHGHAIHLQPLRKHMRNLQNLLGELNDNAVKIESVTRYAATLESPSFRAELLDLGRYIGLCENSSVSLRRRFPRQWQQFDHHCKRRHLKAWIHR